MAVPSSGLLRMSGLFSEFNEDDYTAYNNDGEIILLSGGSSGTWGTVNTNSSSYPTTTNPDKMSEFYGYDHDASAASSLTSFGATPTQSKAACGYGTNLPNTNYHDGTGLIAVGDNVYSDEDGESSLANGQYKVGPFVGTYYNIVVSSGEITSRQTCP
jgi:hypothetical protein